MADRESLVNEFQLGTLIDRLAARLGGEIRFPIRRPDDHLVLDLLFDNLHVDTSRQPPQLTRADTGRRGVLIVEFPPQSFGERAFQKVTPALDETQLPATSSETVKGLGAAYVRMSGRSRLAFTMPADVAGIPFTLEAVLDAMRQWPLRLDVNALPDLAIVTGRLERTFEVIHDAISVNLDPRVRSDVGVALKDSARRIAEMAAGGLHESRTDDVSSVMWSGIREESARLAARHQELGAADLHTATLAALALGSGARLGRLAESSGIAEQARPALEKLPVLPDVVRDAPRAVQQCDRAGVALSTRDVSHRRRTVAARVASHRSSWTHGAVAHATQHSRGVGWRGPGTGPGVMVARL